jgi:hypothetical protein
MCIKKQFNSNTDLQFEIAIYASHKTVASAANFFNVLLPVSLHHRLNACDIPSPFNSNDNLFGISEFII